MTMDLWYDLAVRESPPQDDDVLEKMDLADAPRPDEDEADTEADEEVVALDFF
jgi:hypothetical protein